MQGTKTDADATTRHKENSLYFMYCKGLKPAAQHSTKRFNSRKSDCFKLTSFSLFYCSFTSSSPLAPLDFRQSASVNLCNIKLDVCTQIFPALIFPSNVHAEGSEQKFRQLLRAEFNQP